ncbi:MAG: Gfo/Idh/MocA family oxidoreductase [Armatimonadota bacterium]|nr:Gfo/Idh/MocA family oxidoreductase [Armatimonadota bacterium]
MLFRLALIGCGGVSTMHLDTYARHPDRVQVVAACDPDPNRLAQVQARYSIPTGFSSLPAMINECSWDVAVVCTPSRVREEVVGALAAAGKSIFVEKPLASSLPEAERMVAACAAAGVRLAVDQNFRYHYPFHLAKDRLAEGLIGPVTTVLHQDLFFRQDMGWRTEEKRHALAVMGVHWLDGIRWILQSEAVAVYAQMRSASTIQCAGETDANISINFENGVTANYVQSFSSALSRTETLIIGERGVLKLDYNRLEFHDRSGKQQPVEQWENPYAGSNKPESTFQQLDALLQAISDGHEPANSGQDNLRTVALLEACYRSASEGQIVSLKNGSLL